MCVHVLYIFNSHNYVYLETDFFEQVKQVMITAYSFYTPLKALVRMIVSLHSYSVVKKKNPPHKRLTVQPFQRPGFIPRLMQQQDLIPCRQSSK